jgi:hypothetical protein
LSAPSSEEPADQDDGWGAEGDDGWGEEEDNGCGAGAETTVTERESEAAEETPGETAIKTALVTLTAAGVSECQSVSERVSVRECQ